MAIQGAKASLDALVDEVWEAALGRNPHTAITAGRTVASLGRGDIAEAEAVAAIARDRRDRLDRIDISGLDRTDRLTAAFVRHWLNDEMEEPQRWWTGFGIAPYSSFWLSMLPPMLFGPIDTSDPIEAARYLKLAHEFVDAVDALRERVVAQSERGWRLPKPALPTARKSLEGHASIAISAITLTDDRAASSDLRTAIATLVDHRLKPAFVRLLDTIGPDYEAAAPDDAGLMHQPGGADAYRLWIRHHLGRDVDPVDIHKLGLNQVALLAAEMERVRADGFGYIGDEAAFHDQLQQDPKAKAATAQELEATYNRHMAKMASVFSNMFLKAPHSPAVVKRLPVELEAGMTFGYYHMPTDIGADGIYFYSGNGIPDRMQLNAAALIFHELVPGHHFHLARQQENAALPIIRRTFDISTAFKEGWAEYASGLGEEAGLFEDPYDYYGFLSHQRFVAQRLVVDTGLNALGWTLAQAHAYMSAHTLEKPEQVTSDILRYATDLPAQALCYRWGCLKFRELRAKAERVLGAKFDLADFHEAILEQGALPFPVLEDSLDEWAADRAAADN